MKTTLLILISALLIGWCGYGFGQVTVEPQLRFIIQPHYRVVEVPVEVPVLEYIEVEKVVEVEKEVPRPGRLFENIEEFDAWWDGVCETYAVMRSGTCIEMAKYYVLRAAEDGFIISWEIVDPDGLILWEPVRTKQKDGHLGLTVITQDCRIYYVEPETGDRTLIYRWD